MDFIIHNIGWFVGIGLILLLALIGYYADKEEQEKNNNSDKQQENNNDNIDFVGEKIGYSDNNIKSENNLINSNVKTDNNLIDDNGITEDLYAPLGNLNFYKDDNGLQDGNDTDVSSDVDYSNDNVLDVGSINDDVNNEFKNQNIILNNDNNANEELSSPNDLDIVNEKDSEELDSVLRDNIQNTVNDNQDIDNISNNDAIVEDIHMTLDDLENKDYSDDIDDDIIVSNQSDDIGDSISVSDQIGTNIEDYNFDTEVESENNDSDSVDDTLLNDSLDDNSNENIFNFSNEIAEPVIEQENKDMDNSIDLYNNEITDDIWKF